MSFEKADKALQHMSQFSSQHLETEAMVEALKAVAQTVNSAEKAMIQMAANPITLNLRELKIVGEKTSSEMNNLTTELRGFRSSMDELNNILKKFDDGASKLGQRANLLAMGLLFAAAVQAFATLVQVFK